MSQACGIAPDQIIFEPKYRWLPMHRIQLKKEKSDRKDFFFLFFLKQRL
jgi:hypothetical protein